MKNGQLVEHAIPSPMEEVIPGVKWGSPETLFTPAFWLTQYWMHEPFCLGQRHAFGTTLAEEVVACLLGGHGIPAQVALAAFDRLRVRGILAQDPPSFETISRNLQEPLHVSGRQVTYRFWSQKARYVSAALLTLRHNPAPQNCARDLRTYLLQIPGVGYKISSWVVRNWLNSDDVAILDIHLIRAGRLMGLFSTKDQVSKDYLDMERRFLDLAQAMDTHASDLDALIWMEMRQAPRLVSRLLSGLG